MKVGTLLTAIDPCTDPVTETPLLTVGKEYEVIEVKSRYFYIIDDRGLRHSFGIPHHENYFQSITPESLDELGFEKDKIVDVWWMKVSDMYSMTADSKGVYLNGHRVPNCKTLTDLKHLIRILGV